MRDPKGCAGITTVAGGAIGIFAGMTCAGRTGGPGLNAGVGSNFLGMRKDLVSTASRSGVLVSTSVTVEIFLIRSYLALAATRLAFFKSVFEEVPLFFLERAIFSIFLFNRFSQNIYKLRSILYQINLFCLKISA